MKRRNGFVSNSSSSSFTCEICDETVEGRDLGISEADMCSCVNGHTFCTEHAVAELTCAGLTEEQVDDQDSEVDDYIDFDHYEIDEACCPICNYQEMSYYDAQEYLEKKYSISKDEVFQKIKEVNRRRKKLYPEEYVKHVFDLYGLTDDSFLEEIKTAYKTYAEYKKAYKKEILK